MSVIDDSKAAIMHLASLTSGFSQGSPPDPYSLLAAQSNLVRLHLLLGEEMAHKFGGKERAYLNRKVQQAKVYLSNRIPIEGKKPISSTDAAENSLLSVGEEYQREIDAMEEFELLRILMKSLQNALDHSRSVGSFLRSSENLPSSS